jgi:hypothetical protein
LNTSVLLLSITDAVVGHQQQGFVAGCHFYIVMADSLE